MQAYRDTVVAFKAAKMAYANGTTPWVVVEAAHEVMKKAEEEARYHACGFKGWGHWAPSSYDRRLPLELHVEARDLGKKFWERLQPVKGRLVKPEPELAIGEADERCEACWAAGDYCGEHEEDGYPDDYWLECMDNKECFRFYVRKYIETLPADDPDLLAYNGLWVRAEEYKLPPKRLGEAAEPGEGKSRTARWRRNKPKKPEAPPAVALPGL